MKDPLLSYRMVMQLHAEDKRMVAPVAEYKGAAIIEQPGKLTKVFRGQSYKTDGFAYLMQASQKRDCLSLIQFKDERTVKAFLEQTTERFMSMEEVCKLVGLPLSIGPWEWNEHEGRFEQPAVDDYLQRNEQ
jgi:hypothetical protein